MSDIRIEDSQRIEITRLDRKTFIQYVYMINYILLTIFLAIFQDFHMLSGTYKPIAFIEKQLFMGYGFQNEQCNQVIDQWFQFYVAFCPVAMGLSAVCFCLAKKWDILS